MSDIKATLELAAASPDPAVRSAVLQYGKLRQQLTDLDGFFSFYAAAAAEAVPLAKTSVRPRIVATEEPDEDSGDFLRQVTVVLTAHGSPLGFQELRDAFFVRFPDAIRVSDDTFRQRLRRLRIKNALQFSDDTSRYWVGGRPVAA